MSDTIKAALLDNIQEEFNQLETLLSPLSDVQLTTPTVNSTWSIKDNLAHLTAWHGYLLHVLAGVLNDKEPQEYMPGYTNEDEANEPWPP